MSRREYMSWESRTMSWACSTMSLFCQPRETARNSANKVVGVAGTILRLNAKSSRSGRWFSAASSNASEGRNITTKSTDSRTSALYPFRPSCSMCRMTASACAFIRTSMFSSDWFPAVRRNESIGVFASIKMHLPLESMTCRSGRKRPSALSIVF